MTYSVSSGTLNPTHSLTYWPSGSVFHCVCLVGCRYVFKRLKFLGNKELSQAITLFFLALWHGLYSGYFMNFALEFFVVLFEKQVCNARVPTLLCTI